MSDLYQRHFGYDKVTGKLWHITSKGRCKAGQEITALDAKGYVRTQFQGKKILGHRLAWLLAYGTEPVGIIDHINGVKSDNRLENLRLADHTTNQCNIPYRSSNTGIKGISIHANGYMAHISYRGKQYTKYSKDLGVVKVWLDAKRQELHKEFAKG